jgi:hypothetical protein
VKKSITIAFPYDDCLTLFVRQRKGKNFFNFALEAGNGHPHLSALAGKPRSARRHP